MSKFLSLVEKVHAILEANEADAQQPVVQTIAPDAGGPENPPVQTNTGGNPNGEKLPAASADDISSMVKSLAIYLKKILPQDDSLRNQIESLGIDINSDAATVAKAVQIIKNITNPDNEKIDDQKDFPKKTDGSVETQYEKN
jgi:hypothetical protein